LSQESAGKRAREGVPKSTPRREKIGKKCKKDTILTEQTYRSIENKGLNFLEGSKQTGF
jgi:hypothetical protein